MIKEVVYPVVNQKMFQELVAEFGTLSTDAEREAQETTRSANSHFYRSVLMLVLDVLTFRSNNAVLRSVIDALAVLRPTVAAVDNIRCRRGADQGRRTEEVASHRKFGSHVFLKHT
ncbi:MAG: hypothetical protein HHJ12_13355 [Glaciimonas sp.]|nr:hypothetical protein [Glaciimonas sp.]